MAEKHTRLDSQFSSVAAIWEPASSSDWSSGTLTVDDDGVSFTTAPIYRDTLTPSDVREEMGWVNRSTRDRVEAYQGFGSEGKFTLCNLTKVERPGLVDFGQRKSIVAETYHATVLVNGVHFNGLDDKCFEHGNFTFTGLNQWLPELRTETWEGEAVVITIPHSSKDLFSFSLLDESHAVIELCLGGDLKSGDTGDRISRTVPFVRVTPHIPATLDWFLSMGNRLENLFSLLLGSSQSLETISVSQNGEIGSVVAKRYKTNENFSVLSCVPSNLKHVAIALSRWLTTSPEFKQVEDIALGVLRRGKLFYETEFLSLAQALEGLHRATCEQPLVDKTLSMKLRNKVGEVFETENVDESLAQKLCQAMIFALEPSFASRLKELRDQLPPSMLRCMYIDDDKFIRDVRNTRNYFTHAGTPIGRKRNPLRGVDIFFINQRMKALLRCLLLLYVGYPPEAFGDIATREATKWS